MILGFGQTGSKPALRHHGPVALLVNPDILEIRSIPRTLRLSRSLFVSGKAGSSESANHRHVLQIPCNLISDVGCINAGRFGIESRYQGMTILYKCLGNFDASLQNRLIQ